MLCTFSPKIGTSNILIVVAYIYSHTNKHEKIWPNAKFFQNYEILPNPGLIIKLISYFTVPGLFATIYRLLIKVEILPLRNKSRTTN